MTAPWRAAISALAIAVATFVASCATSEPDAGEAGGGHDVAGGAGDARVGAIESIADWSFDGARGREIVTANYRIFTTERDAVIVDRAPRFLELALDHYRSALGPLPPPTARLETFILDNRPQWQQMVLAALGDRGRPYLRIARGGFALSGRAYLYDLGLFDTLAIAAHEGWHQYTQRTFRDPLPIWAEEGVAAYMEGHRWAGSTPVFSPWANVERFDQLRAAAARGGLARLQDLLGQAPNELLLAGGDGALTYYAQVWALVHFLREGGDGRRREPLRDLLLDASTGNLRVVLRNRLEEEDAIRALVERRGDDLFRAYFGDDIAAVDREYHEFLDRLVRAGSRDAVVEGRSPLGQTGASFAPSSR